MQKKDGYRINQRSFFEAEVLCNKTLLWKALQDIEMRSILEKPHAQASGTEWTPFFCLNKTRTNVF